MKNKIQKNLKDLIFDKKWLDKKWLDNKWLGFYTFLTPTLSNKPNPNPNPIQPTLTLTLTLATNLTRKFHRGSKSMTIHREIS
jgi:hypothetical protein